MKNPVFAIIISLSVLITSAFATPAKAENLDAGDIGALITFFVIGKAILDNIEEPAAKAPKAKSAAPANPGKGWKKRKPKRFVVLPDVCRFRIRGEGRRSIHVYGRDCLHEFLPRAGHLPASCLMKVQTPYDHKRRVYRADCLFKAGYQPEQQLRVKRY